MPQGITGRALFNLCLCIWANFFGVSYFLQDKTQSKHLSIHYLGSPSASVYSVKTCSQKQQNSLPPLHTMCRYKQNHKYLNKRPLTGFGKSSVKHHDAIRTAKKSDDIDLMIDLMIE